MTLGTKAIVIGAVANLFLSLIKFTGGVFGNSIALVADAFHSLSDLITDGVVYFSHAVGQLPPDKNYPYGHGRAETIGTTLVGLLIIITGLGVALEAWQMVTQNIEKTPSWLAASIAILSVCIKEVLYRYTHKVGEALKSPSLTANAWHHRTDAISSIAVFIGILGAWNGIIIMDPFAGGMVGLMICKVGYDFSREGFRDLMDTALSEEHTQRIFSILDEIPEVMHYHDLRSRTIGGEILIDVHILVDWEMTITEGHLVAEVVRRNIIKAFKNVQDVLVHVDGELDAEVENLYHLTRKELIEITNHVFKNMHGVKTNPEIRTHHIKGRTVLDVFLQMEGNQEMEEIQKQIYQVKSRLQAIPQIDRARVFLDFNNEFGKRN
jgi:cation diffusion facilitator family transporter